MLNVIFLNLEFKFYYKKTVTYFINVLQIIRYYNFRVAIIVRYLPRAYLNLF